MPSIGAIGDYPLSSYNSLYTARGVGRTMVKEGAGGFYSMPLPSSRMESMAAASAAFVGTSLSLALSAKGASAWMLRAFIAYGQNLSACSQLAWMARGVRVNSLALMGTSGLIGKSTSSPGPFSHMMGRVITSVRTLPGPPFIATFLIYSMSKVSMRGYRTIWQYMQGSSASNTFASPGMLFKRFIWAARSAFRSQGKVSSIGTLPFLGRIKMVHRARRSLSVAPMILSGGQSKIMSTIVPGIVRHAYLQGIAKSRLVDSLSNYAGRIYLHVASKTITLVRLYVTGRIPFPRSFSMMKSSMRNRGPVVTTKLSGHSDIRSTKESSLGVFLTLAVIAGSAVARSLGREAISVTAHLTGHSEEVVQARAARVYSSMTLRASSVTRVIVRIRATVTTHLLGRTRSMVRGLVPVIFGTVLMLRSKTRMMVKSSAGTLGGRVALHAFSSIKDKARKGFIQYPVHLPATISKSVSNAVGSTLTYFSLLTAFAWQGVMGHITPMSWPLLPNLQSGRHVCNTHQRVRYVCRNILDPEICDCQT